MSELLDVFDDEGLLDPDTRSFLVEALSNSGPDEWRDVLEPFLTPEPALAVLTSVPNVLERSLKALETKEDLSGPAAASAVSIAFLDSLSNTVFRTNALGMHTLARCSRLCRRGRQITSDVGLWLPRVESTCSYWGLPTPSAADGTWREKYFQALRPRFDGIYVGECSFQRWVPVGNHTCMRKNAASLSAHGGRGGSWEIIRYRRYARLLPPHWCLVVQDACPLTVAEGVLIKGVDIETHTNIAKLQSTLSDGGPMTTDAETLRKKICLGQFTFSPETSAVEIKYTAGEDDYQMSFALSHGGPHTFADRLEWSLYTKTTAGDVTEYNLGRLPEWKGGGLADEGKDHFPCMDLRPNSALEHFLY